MAMAKTVGQVDLPATDKGRQTWLLNVSPPTKRTWLPFGGGLIVALEPSGLKVFQARLRRFGDANPRRVTLGHFPECSVADARQRLAEAKAAVKEGKDPALERRRAREGIVGVATLGQLLDGYLARRAEGGDLRRKSLAIEESALAPLRKALGDRLLSDLEPRDFADLIAREAARLRKKGRTGRLANIALGAVKRAFRDARGRGEFSAVSPVADLRRPTTESARKRVLFDGKLLAHPTDPKRNEIGQLTQALRRGDDGKMEQGTRAALLLSMMLGLRAGEVASLQWRALRLDDATPTLTILSGKTEAAERTLPLPTQAVAVLHALKASAASRETYCFPAREGSKRSPHLHPESLSRAFTRLCDGLKISETTLHDLRRTALSALMEICGDENLVQRIAGHTRATTLARHYDRAKRLDAMAKPLKAWAAAIDAAERAAKETELQQ